MRCLLILFLMYCCLSSYGQTVTGTVTDKGTGQPVTGAWVTLSKAAAISGVNGEFAIDASKLRDTIKVKMQGYKPYALAVDPSVNKHIQIILDEDIIELNVVHITVKRNRLKDSLNNRKLFAKDFNTAAPKLKDMIVVASAPGPLPVAGITIVPSQFIRALTYKHSREYKFKKVLLRDERNRYIDSRFSEGLVTALINLKDDSLLNFMDKYRPDIDMIKKMTDYDIRVYIKESLLKFREKTVGR